jgi:hypothetical protein
MITPNRRVRGETTSGFEEKEVTLADWGDWAGIGAFIIGVGALLLSYKALKRADRAVNIAQNIGSVRIYEGAKGGEGGLGGGGGGGGAGPFGGAGGAGGAANFGPIERP